MTQLFETLWITFLSVLELLNCVFWNLAPVRCPFKPQQQRCKADSKKVLKRCFKPDRVPDRLDAIVIGSGMSGLSVASLLANTGRKVLVLEQHDRAGGCLHSFEKAGFEFDVGFHYVGRLGTPTLPFRTLLDSLTNGEVEWDALDEAFDEIVIGNETYHSYAGDRYWTALESTFPNEVGVLSKYRTILDSIAKTRAWLGIMKLLPLPVLNWLNSVGFLDWITPFFRYARKSTWEVLSEIGASPTLQKVLTHAYGTSGCLPDSESFLMHALISIHFLKGGFYPRGGFSRIASAMIPSITEAGGDVLVGANVREILIQDGRAVGVSVQKGRQIANIFAPIVISSIGIQGTFGKLLPRELSEASRYFKYISQLGPGLSGLSIFVGLDATAEELNLKNRNFFIFNDSDFTESFSRFLGKSFDEAVSGEAPHFFVSFPSSKDAIWDETRPGRSTCTVLTFVNYDWFSTMNAEGKKPAKRREEYELLKREFGHFVWQHVLKKFPQLNGKEVYFEVGTPLTNNFYISSTRGEFYGLDHSTARFTAQAMGDLRPQTDIDGLYLTGQDVFVCGLVGAVYSALITTSVILKRSCFYDLYWLTFKRQMQRKWKDAIRRVRD